MVPRHLRPRNVDRGAPKEQVFRTVLTDSAEGAVAKGALLAEDGRQLVMNIKVKEGSVACPPDRTQVLCTGMGEKTPSMPSPDSAWPTFSTPGHTGM